MKGIRCEYRIGSRSVEIRAVCCAGMLVFVALFRAMAIEEGIYWTDFSGGSLKRSALNGSGVSQIASSEDMTTDTKIVRSDLNGQAITDLVTGFARIEGIAISNDYIYWSNWGEGSIARARLDGSDVEPQFIKQQAFGIFVVSASPGSLFRLLAGQVIHSEDTIRFTVQIEGTIPRGRSFRLWRSETLRPDSWIKVSGEAFDLQETNPGSRFQFTIREGPSSANATDYYRVTYE